MGSESKITFEDNCTFYLCDACGSHVAKQDDWFLVEHFGEEPVMYYHNAVNLTVDTEQNYRTEGQKIVADVHCACERLLGYKIVRLAPGLDQLILHTREVPVGTFVLHFFKLWKWNGQRYVRADQH